MDAQTLLETLAPWAGLYVVASLSFSWLLLPWLNRRIDSGPWDGALSVLVECWLRIWHHPRFEGLEAIPSDWTGGMAVVSNHASGIDSFVLQLCLRRRIRWMMAKDQMLPALDGVWRHLQVIPVTYGPADAGSFREAVRHLHRGGVLGLFPEGGIARPPRQVRPFLGGIGLLIARSKAPVALFLIDGAPEAPTALGSMFRFSQTTVRCLGWLDYRGERDPAVIAADLRQRLADASGWPLNDEALVAERAVASTIQT